ncbi:hypothetical protein G9A89_015201 [Geosiphon pyriformis]|nr:hypothetical protein G9A89_015201 [Geosiphon pyriformis]
MQKKHRIELPTNPSYYYTPGSAINIALAGMSTSNAISTFEQFPFQSKQKKEDLLGPYGAYFKGFKSKSPMPSRKPTKSEKEQEKEEEKKSEDQEFTYQNPITENLDIGTLNFQTQQNQNLENPEIKTPPNQNDQNPNLINQYNLPPNIIIDQSLIELIIEPIQQQ